MSLTTLGNHPKEEYALVEIATAILTEHKETMPFSLLVQEIQEFLGVDAEAFKPRLSQFYTDLNTDGSFISLGNNEWALRAWYPVDAIDESIHELDDEDDAPKRKKSSKKKLMYLPIMLPMTMLLIIMTTILKMKISVQLLLMMPKPMMMRSKLKMMTRVMISICQMMNQSMPI
ncbi:hypothetical protein GCM10025879_06700 [Leuconostoc litchii]|nr:hypothetical protein GCM10025879_06700 [Leuconostoc litchii]